MSLRQQTDWDSCDRIEILWSGGVTEAIYADHRHGGRVIVDLGSEGLALMELSEFGQPRKVKGGMGRPHGPLDDFYEQLLESGEVDDTTAVAK